MLRTDLGGDPSFQSLLARVREVAVGAYDHAELATAHRDPSSQVMFVLGQERGSRRLGELVLVPLALRKGASPYEWTLCVTSAGDELIAALEVDVELFSPAVAERALADYRGLLEGIVADPEQRLSELPIGRRGSRRSSRRCSGSVCGGEIHASGGLGSWECGFPGVRQTSPQAPMGDLRVKGPSLPPGRGSWGRWGARGESPRRGVRGSQLLSATRPRWAGNLMLRALADAPPGPP